MTPAPAAHADAWREFSDAYTEHGTVSWKARAVELLAELAFTDTGTHEFTARLSPTPSAFKEARRDLEDVMNALGAASGEPGDARSLHHAVIDSLIARWVELEREHGLYPPPVRSPKEGVTRAERDEIAGRQHDLLQTPEGGLVAGMLRMGMEQTLQAVARQLLGADTREERVEEAVREAEARFNSALFSFDPARGSAFPGFIYRGLVRFVPSQITRSRKKERLFACSVDDACAGSGGEPLRDALPDDSVPDPAGVVEQAEEKAVNTAAVRDLMSGLTPRQRAFVSRRYGLDGSEAAGIKEIAGDMGVCRMTAYAIERDAMRHMRREREERNGGENGRG